MPAADSMRVGALPIGLAHHVKLRNTVKAGATVRWSDVVVDESSEPVRVRREMEGMTHGNRSAAKRSAAE
jgi:predicted homoserine dehydrogenase-like protein